jgi:hypothetical protein
MELKFLYHWQSFLKVHDNHLVRFNTFSNLIFKKCANFTNEKLA